ncbi:elongation factor 1-beta [Candidatus Pacearchaeota archaeon]|nr:elongation factor 1-beta [Candidatus Pacearchaeota archaeon]
MGFTAVQMKLMPESPSVDLKAIEVSAEQIINSMHKTQVRVEEQPIAFGLKAIILSFAWNDEIELEKLEAEFQKIPQVSSVEVLDIRKAFG